MNNSDIKKIILGFVLTLFCWGINISTFAQQAASGLAEATTEVKNMFEPASKLMMAIGAVVGIVGAIRVYSKWNAGDQDTQKHATGWIGACLFLVVVGAVLKAFFG